MSYFYVFISSSLFSLGDVLIKDGNRYQDSCKLAWFAINKHILEKFIIFSCTNWLLIAPDVKSSHSWTTMVLAWIIATIIFLSWKTKFYNNSRNSALCTFYVIKGTTKSYLDTDWSNLSEVFCFIWHCTTFLLRIYKNGISNVSTFHKIIVHIILQHGEK